MDTILYGPERSGKTTASKKIAKKYGHTKIIDGATESDLKEYYGKNVLFIVNEKPNYKWWQRRKYRILEMK